MALSESGTTNVAVKYGDTQLAVYHVPKRGFYATQQMCPHRRAFVLDHGIIGNTPTGDLVSHCFHFSSRQSLHWITLFFQYVSCPLHKRNFSLTEGKCLNDPDYEIVTFEARVDGSSDIQLLLPPKDDINGVLGTERWLIRQAESEALGLNAATQVEMVGINGLGSKFEDEHLACAVGGACGDKRLEW